MDRNPYLIYAHNGVHIDVHIIGYTGYRKRMFKCILCAFFRIYAYRNLYLIYAYRSMHTGYGDLLLEMICDKGL
jgi:hypothetical protein